MSRSARDLFHRRRRSVRAKLAKAANGRPRLCVFRSNKHIYAQVVDDVAGRTLAAVSTKHKEVSSEVKATGNRAAAEVVGRLIAQRATAAGVDQVVFDRSGYLFHGRVKALADAAREAGLRF